MLEKGRLVGIVSRGDLREASISASINADQYELHFLLNKLTVGKLMSVRCAPLRRTRWWWTPPT